MRRQIHRVDEIQPAIVSALRAAGCTVQSLTSVGNGCPDLLVARAGKLWLLEIKSGSEDLNAVQLAWLNGWNSPVHVVRSVEQALSVLALHVREKASA